MNEDIDKIINQSMQENKKLLDTLGAEKPVKLLKNPDNDLLSMLADLMPKSTEGKLAVAGGIAILAGI